MAGFNPNQRQNKQGEWTHGTNATKTGRNKLSGPGFEPFRTNKKK